MRFSCSQPEIDQYSRICPAGCYTFPSSDDRGVSASPFYQARAWTVCSSPSQWYDVGAPECSSSLPHYCTFGNRPARALGCSEADGALHGLSGPDRDHSHQER